MAFAQASILGWLPRPMEALSPRASAANAPPRDEFAQACRHLLEAGVHIRRSFVGCFASLLGTLCAIVGLFRAVLCDLPVRFVVGLCTKPGVVSAEDVTETKQLKKKKTRRRRTRSRCFAPCLRTPTSSR